MGSAKVFEQRIEKLVHGYNDTKNIPKDVLDFIILLLVSISNKIIFSLCYRSNNDGIMRFEVYFEKFVSKMIPNTLIKQYSLSTSSKYNNFKVSTLEIYKDAQNLGFIDVDTTTDSLYTLSGDLHAIQVIAVDINENVIVSSDSKSIYFTRGTGFLGGGYQRRYNFDGFFAENINKNNDDIVNLEQWITNLRSCQDGLFIDFNEFEMKRIYYHIIHHNGDISYVIDQNCFVKFMQAYNCASSLETKNCYFKFVEIVKGQCMESTLHQLSLFSFK